jgi:hypothetical protein
MYRVGHLDKRFAPGIDVSEHLLLQERNVVHV